MSMTTWPPCWGKGSEAVYVPTTLAVWQRLVANASIFQVSGTAFAVTPALRESYVEQHNAQTTYSSKAYSVPDRDKKENFGLAATSGV